jgi:hypothetical protein
LVERPPTRKTAQSKRRIEIENQSGCRREDIECIVFREPCVGPPERDGPERATGELEDDCKCVAHAKRGKPDVSQRNVALDCPSGVDFTGKRHLEIDVMACDFE